MPGDVMCAILRSGVETRAADPCALDADIVFEALSPRGDMQGKVEAIVNENGVSTIRR
jgi:hypothetical protein